MKLWEGYQDSELDITSWSIALTVGTPTTPRTLNVNDVGNRWTAKTEEIEKLNNQLNETPDMNIYKVWLKGKDGDMFGMLVEAVDERDAVDILALLMNVEHPHDAVVQLVEDGDHIIGNPIRREDAEKVRK